MAAKIQLEIVTPDGIQLSEEVDEFTAPSVQGEFGVMVEHRPLLAGLKTGIVAYVQAGERHPVAIGPGFAKIANDKATITTETFIAKGDVDAVVARRDLKEAEEALGALPQDASEDDKAHCIKAARWAAVRLELYGDPPPPTIILGHEINLLGHEDYAETLVKSDTAEAHGEREG